MHIFLETAKLVPLIYVVAKTSFLSSSVHPFWLETQDYDTVGSRYMIVFVLVLLVSIQAGIAAGFLSVTFVSFQFLSSLFTCNLLNT